MAPTPPMQREALGRSVVTVLAVGAVLAVGTIWTVGSIGGLALLRRLLLMSLSAGDE